MTPLKKLAKELFEKFGSIDLSLCRKLTWDEINPTGKRHWEDMARFVQRKVLDGEINIANSMQWFNEEDFYVYKSRYIQDLITELKELENVPKVSDM